MGTAKAMAYALQIPLYGVMTMDSLASFVIAASDLLDKFRETKEEVLFLGDGIKRIEKLLEERDTNLTVLDISQRIPKASSLLLAGRELVEREEICNPMDMVPYYIRRSEAEVLWEERHKNNPEMLNQNPTVIVTEAAGAE